LVNRPPEQDRLLSVAEVAQQVGFSDQTILNWIKSKKLPAMQIQRNYRIRQSDVDRVIEAHSTTAPGLADDSFWEDPDAQEFQVPGGGTSR
jgi:excisionase family DNA binding protein